MFLFEFFYIFITDTQCGSLSYDITSTGIPDATPQPLQAWEGVPFLPELEPNYRKYFRVKSGTNVALFLTSSPQIIDENTDSYYTIGRCGLRGDVCNVYEIG